MSNKLTFNGVLDEMNANQVSSEAIRVMERLRDIYAPTIEMTKNQYLFVNSEYEKESIVDAVANLTVDDIIKYTLRVGKKDEPQQDMGKVVNYADYLAMHLAGEWEESAH